MKDKPQYFDLDPDFKPLPRYGHLSEKTPEFLAAEDAIRTGYDGLWSLPDIPTFRQVAGDRDAAMPPGGPDRYRDLKTELLQFPARDGHLIELKVYKSPNVVPDAALVYRMHGGGMAPPSSAHFFSGLFILIFTTYFRLLRWTSRGRWHRERLRRHQPQYRRCQR